MRQTFFEMGDVRPWQGSPWVPLRLCVAKELSFSGGGEAVTTFDGVATLAVTAAHREVADRFGWAELSIQPNRSVVDRDGYHAADSHRSYDADQPTGVRLVIDQFLEEQDLHIWHLHPDLVIALRLLREGDTWFRPEEGWAEVVRLERDGEGSPTRIEIRSEFLTDYLTATGSALLLSTYHERRSRPARLPAFTWRAGSETVVHGRDTFERRIENRRDGNWVSGALWRTEWFEPAPFSPRVRGDPDRSPTTFALDNLGRRCTPAELQGAQEWLYFRPELALALARHRGFTLHWGSEQVGGMGATRNGVHFGLNSLGLLNIFAKDIAALEPWEQRIWSAHNVPPDGGVSAELFAAQMELRPARSVAPETRVAPALGELDARLTDVLGSPLLRPHATTDTLFQRIHRFRAAEEEGLLHLARSLAMLFAERIDVVPIHRLLGPRPGTSSAH